MKTEGLDNADGIFLYAAPAIANRFTQIGLNSKRRNTLPNMLAWIFSESSMKVWKILRCGENYMQ